MQIWQYNQLGLNIVLFRIQIESHMIFFKVMCNTSHYLINAGS